MILLDPNMIIVNQTKIDEIDYYAKSIYRLIIYSRHHLDDDLLDIYLEGVSGLQELLSLKNAQMEAQNEEEAKEYLENLKKSLTFVLDEIIAHENFTREIQLFQLLRLISPEANIVHPNRYRQTHVQIGGHICPDPEHVGPLISELFFKMQKISNPIIRAIYFHHELIRIHPFVDGNGRVTRIAKNWMLMFEMYPPIFINDSAQKKEYVSTLSNSFNMLERNPFEWNEFTEKFFEQELNRLHQNIIYLYDSINLIGKKREENSRGNSGEL